MTTLAPQRARFCAEYVVDFNATEAALRSGYRCSTRHAAGVRGHSLLKRRDVQQEVARLQQRLAEKVELNAEWVLRKLRDVAEQVDVTQGAKVRALELIGKHVGMFVEKHEHTVKFTPAERAARVGQLLKKGSAA